MTFSFDLLSDLHVDSWPNFDWTDQATSPYAIVAGDVAADRDLLIKTLTHLGQVYGAVFYIDGNEEHRTELEDLPGSYQDLVSRIQDVPNVVYLQDNVVIINGVAILATNGWWGFDFDDIEDQESSIAWYCEYTGASRQAAEIIAGMSLRDCAYMANSVKKLQTHRDVKSIVAVSHTLPAPWIVDHDLDIVGTHRFNSMGNQHLNTALEFDTENKIHNWVFGHYHKPVDQFHQGIRYVSNPRGRGNTPWCQTAYNPKRIVVDV